ncbi:hypothetical protein MB84_16770 [Pandoraea oxalativorans]|uniref:Diguanylate cyclase n=1 Tax=Pandoraea oxalativorans TaxID=573737 RepID=A0A0E3YH64_9BURK|nr:hypothetical protein MB84_16770 [Pandoraea oxalativorans]
MSDFVDLYIRYWIIPVWLLAGFADWVCHRRSRIEENAGTKESAMHVAQMLEVGIPLMIALLFQINPIVIAIMVLGIVLHEFTALWDVHYAKQHRDISTIEQHIHSFLELLPICAVTLIIGVNAGELWNTLAGGVTSDLSMSPSAVPLAYTLCVLVAAVIFAALPYTEELIRCLRYRHRASLRRAKDVPRE